MATCCTKNPSSSHALIPPPPPPLNLLPPRLEVLDHSLARFLEGNLPIDHQPISLDSCSQDRPRHFGGFDLGGRQAGGAMMMMGYLWPPRGQQGGGRKQQAERESLLVDGGGEGAAVPRGYFAVYVGAEARRFVVPMSYLCQPAFRELMERAAEEFGFGQVGGLRIPCREEDFRTTVAALRAAESRQRRRRSKINTMAAIKA